ncbi:MAG TPA: PaaI family thioesterase [Pseudomonadales bacterium]|nr:PaaI family thioesterase [Pseudomonadales bacterium]
MDSIRSDANRCFVCGPGNASGLKLKFRLQDDECVSTFTPGELHCGYDGITHGGIIFSVLDDVMANWLYLRGMKAVTAKCDIRFKTSLPTGESVSVRSWHTRQRGPLAMLSAEMRLISTNTLIAECDASFMIQK